MAGIKDLDILLSNIEPILDERDFVFCSFLVWIGSKSAN